MNAAPDVTVIVPARNAMATIEELLAALAAQTLARERWEALVVDDGSTDDTPQVVERSGVARVVRRAASGGSYASRNAGIAQARGRVLAFTDADCVPAPTWLERGLAAVDAGPERLIAGHIEVPLGRRPSPAALVDVVRFLDQESAAAKGFAATANLVLDRAVLDRVGLFNDRLRSGGDFEFGWRAKAAGEQLRYEPGVSVVHQPRHEATELARKGYRIGRANAEQRRYAEGTLAQRPRLWTQPGNWLPRRRLWGMARLEARGIALPPRRVAVMHATQYVFLQVPMVWGSFVGTLHVARAARRA